jgi:hypothetical protein
VVLIQYLVEVEVVLDLRDDVNTDEGAGVDEKRRGLIG